MIISIATYFTGDLSVRGVFFSTMAFLIVVGLFLSYGTLYNRIIDREAVTNGTGYMMIQKIGEKYVDDCYTIAQEILRGILKR